MNSEAFDLFLCILIGYAFGCILPADLIGRFKKKSPFENGSGNPGMTNTIKTMGKTAGALVLGGDILKTILAVILCKMLFPAWSDIAPLYAGIGVMLGHCYPFWHHFQGGKGVAVCCSAYILYAPIPGIIALACGGICLLLKLGVKIAAAVIPLVFCVFLLFRFSWISFVPAFLMGIWLAWMNLRPNRLKDGVPNPEAKSLRKALAKPKDQSGGTQAALPGSESPIPASASLSDQEKIRQPASANRS